MLNPRRYIAVLVGVNADDGKPIYVPARPLCLNPPATQDEDKPCQVYGEPVTKTAAWRAGVREDLNPIYSVPSNQVSSDCVLQAGKYTGLRIGLHPDDGKPIYAVAGEYCGQRRSLNCGEGQVSDLNLPDTLNFTVTSATGFASHLSGLTGVMTAVIWQPTHIRWQVAYPDLPELGDSIRLDWQCGVGGVLDPDSSGKLCDDMVLTVDLPYGSAACQGGESSCADDPFDWTASYGSGSGCVVGATFDIHITE